MDTTHYLSLIMNTADGRTVTHHGTKPFACRFEAERCAVQANQVTAALDPTGRRQGLQRVYVRAA